MSGVRWRASTARELSRSTLSIRLRLILVAILAIVPLVAERVRAARTDHDQRIEATYAEALTLARAAADEQNEFLNVTRGFMQAAAGIYAAATSKGAACENVLANFLKGMPWTTALSVVGRDGRLLCSSDPTMARVDATDRTQIERVLRSGGFVLGEYSFNHRLQRPTLEAAYGEPSADGTIARVLIATLDLDWLSRFGRTAVGRNGALVLMLDGAGTVLAHSPASGQWTGKPLGDDPTVSEMLLRSRGLIAGPGPDRVRRMFAFVQLPGTSTRIAVGLDEAQVLKSANRAMWFAYIQLGAIAGLVLIAIWFGGEHMIARPIQALAAAARRFGRGDLEERVGDKPWAAEFAPLVRAMDDMAAELARRQNELQLFNERLKRLAAVDGLTGLANRREFDAKLKIEWRRAASSGKPLALMMIDVDHFKLFNDHNGHSSGDKVLRTLAAILAAAGRRESDLAARFGGEEFAMILPATDLAAAAAIAEEVRAEVERRRMPHGAAPGDIVTVSIGVAAFPPGPGRPLPSLVEAADMALYAAKHRGRNRISLAEGPVATRSPSTAPSDAEPVDPPAAFVA